MQSGEFHSAKADHPFSVATFGAPTWASLLPPSIVAVGGADQPVERLLTLQSAIAKAVHLVTLVGRLRPGLAPEWPADGSLPLASRRSTETSEIWRAKMTMVMDRVQTASFADDLRTSRPRSLWTSADRGAGAILMALLNWLERARERRQLLALGDRALQDFGASRADAAREGDKPFWRA